MDTTKDGRRHQFAEARAKYTIGCFSAIIRSEAQESA